MGPKVVIAYTPANASVITDKLNSEIPPHILFVDILAIFYIKIKDGLYVANQQSNLPKNDSINSFLSNLMTMLVVSPILLPMKK